jgi:hypothetical protein
MSKGRDTEVRNKDHLFDSVRGGLRAHGAIRGRHSRQFASRLLARYGLWVIRHQISASFRIRSQRTTHNPQRVRTSTAE